MGQRENDGASWRLAPFTGPVRWRLRRRLNPAGHLRREFVIPKPVGTGTFGGENSPSFASSRMEHPIPALIFRGPDHQFQGSMPEKGFYRRLRAITELSIRVFRALDRRIDKRDGSLCLDGGLEGFFEGAISIHFGEDTLGLLPFPLSRLNTQ